MVFMRRRKDANQMWVKQVTQARKQTRGQIASRHNKRSDIDDEDDSYAKSYADPYYNNRDGSIDSYDERYDNMTEEGDSTRVDDANTRDGTNTYDGTFFSGHNETVTQTTNDQLTNDQRTNDQSYSVNNYSIASNNNGMMSQGSQSFGMTLDNYGTPVPRDNFVAMHGYGLNTYETFESNPTMDATERDQMSYGGQSQFDTFDNRSTTQSILKTGNNNLDNNWDSKSATQSILKNGNNDFYDAKNPHAQVIKSSQSQKGMSKKGNMNKKKKSAPAPKDDTNNGNEVKLQKRSSSRLRQVDTDDEATVDILRQMQYKQEERDTAFAESGNLLENLVMNNPVIACLAAPIIPCLVCYNKHLTYKTDLKNEVIARKKRLTKNRVSRIDDEDSLADDSGMETIQNGEKYNDSSINHRGDESYLYDQKYAFQGDHYGHNGLPAMPGTSRTDFDSRASELSRNLSMSSKDSKGKKGRNAQNSVATDDFSMIQSTKVGFGGGLKRSNSGFSATSRQSSLASKFTEFSAIASVAGDKPRLHTAGTKGTAEFSAIKSVAMNRPASSGTKGSEFSAIKSIANNTTGTKGSEFSNIDEINANWKRGNVDQETITYDGTYDNTYDGNDSYRMPQRGSVNGGFSSNQRAWQQGYDQDSKTNDGTFDNAYDTQSRNGSYGAANWSKVNGSFSIASGKRSHQSSGNFSGQGLQWDDNLIATSKASNDYSNAYEYNVNGNEAGGMWGNINSSFSIASSKIPRQSKGTNFSAQGSLAASEYSNVQSVQSKASEYSNVISKASEYSNVQSMASEYSNVGGNIYNNNTKGGGMWSASHNDTFSHASRGMSSRLSQNFGGSTYGDESTFISGTHGSVGTPLPYRQRLAMTGSMYEV